MLTVRDTESFDCFNLFDLGGQSSDIKNIVKTLHYLIDDERFDLVPSDLAAGLILLQREDVLEERAIDIVEVPPLELLEEGLYYNSYAQSAFGWYINIVYQAFYFLFISKVFSRISISIDLSTSDSLCHAF